MSRVEDPRAAPARCDLCVCLSTKLSVCLSVCRPRGPGMRMWPWRMRHGPPRPRGPGVSGVRVSIQTTPRGARQTSNRPASILPKNIRKSLSTTLKTPRWRPKAVRLALHLAAEHAQLRRRSKARLDATDPLLMRLVFACQACLRLFPQACTPSVQIEPALLTPPLVNRLHAELALRCFAHVLCRLPFLVMLQPLRLLAIGLAHAQRPIGVGLRCVPPWLEVAVAGLMIGRQTAVPGRDSHGLLAADLSEPFLVVRLFPL